MEEINLYNKYNKGRHWEKHPTIYAEYFIKFLKSNHFSGLIVDAGSGTGRDLEMFYKAGYDAIGIDFSKKEVDNSKKLHPILKFEFQNIEKMNFKDGDVSAFFCINVIHYVNKKKAIAELLRCLKNKGYLFIHFTIEIIDKYGSIDCFHSKEDILNLISKFKVIENKIIERDDTIPVKHHHKIMELILQKP